ncbi:MAG: cupin domain-containing protein [Chitinophagales bacterium]|nr:cupin domain-containing protein [Chitinophagales bacterium]
MNTLFEIIKVKREYDYFAPDGSEIRLLAKINSGGFCHCTLPVGKISMAVKHKTFEEIWYFLSGEGEMWQKEVNDGEPIKVKQGDSINIPLGNSFQFRNTDTENLCILIATIPNWPGEEEGKREALPVEGYWKHSMN